MGARNPPRRREPAPWRSRISSAEWGANHTPGVHRLLRVRCASQEFRIPFLFEDSPRSTSRAYRRGHVPRAFLGAVTRLRRDRGRDNGFSRRSGTGERIRERSAGRRPGCRGRRDLDGARRHRTLRPAPSPQRGIGTGPRCGRDRPERQLESHGLRAPPGRRRHGECPGSGDQRACARRGPSPGLPLE